MFLDWGALPGGLQEAKKVFQDWKLKRYLILFKIWFRAQWATYRFYNFETSFSPSWHTPGTLSSPRKSLLAQTSLGFVNELTSKDPDLDRDPQGRMSQQWKVEFRHQSFQLQWVSCCCDGISIFYRKINGCCDAFARSQHTLVRTVSI